MQIEISKVSPVRVEGKFPKMDIYFIKDGKENNRTLAGVGETKGVIDVLKAAKEGDVYEISLEKSKDDKYWNWVAANKVAPSKAVETAKSSYQTKSTYETPDERARRNVSIVRQSSLDRAVQYHSAQGKKFSIEEVLDAAGKFANWVFQTDEEKNLERATKLAQAAAIEQAKTKELEDDLPF